jgi:hypothetical protein
MLTSARRGLTDSQNESIQADSQFDLAYGAAHRLLSPRFGNKDTDPRNGSRYFRLSFTR